MNRIFLVIPLLFSSQRKVLRKKVNLYSFMILLIQEPVVTLKVVEELRNLPIIKLILVEVDSNFF
jgi:hypothetical protein